MSGFENLLADNPAIPAERLQATRRLMNDAVPMAMVSGYEEHISVVALPDPNDRHVVAAAITAGASLIVTWSMRHFPTSELRKFGIRKETPDTFLSGLYDVAPHLLISSLANARRNLSRSLTSAEDFVGILRTQKLVRLALRVQRHSSGL